MAADDEGNDVGAVGVPVTGFAAWAPAGTDIPTSAEGAADPLVLDDAFNKVGLLTEDGGLDWTLQPSGDPVVFWQDGYSIPSGLATAELVMKLAQYDELARKLTTGKTADVNGFITIDAAGTADRYALFTGEIFKNGVIRRRVAADASIKTVKVDKSARGEANGTEVTFTVARSSLLNNEHIGEWLIPAPATEVAVVSAATPSAAVAGALVTITGTGFLGATDVKFGATSAVLFEIISAITIKATMPPGSAGSAPVKVVNPIGDSNALAYTRGA